MLYTVKDVVKLTGVTVKALHYYHKIGLLIPCEISEAGYRLYGTRELERLQQILFYRELDFSLKDINKALESEPGRLECLTKQQELLLARRQRMDSLLKTLKESIAFEREGEVMDKSAMFQGLNKEEWSEALAEQNEYLKDKYGYDMIKTQEIDEKKLNESAVEAQKFIRFAADALKNGWKATDERLQKTLGEHIVFLNDHGVSMDAKKFVSQAKFFLQDDFHRSMLENEQIGLSYYLCIAAEMYAAS